jgi:hypothetical protein
MKIKERIQKLVDVNSYRMAVYQWAVEALNEYQEVHLRYTFQQYVAESQMFINQLLAHAAEDNMRLEQGQQAKVVAIKAPAGPPYVKGDTCAILERCMAGESTCKEKYQEAIDTIEDDRTAVAHVIRQQAELQYMAYNHMKTLVECNSYHTQAG